VTMNPHWVNTCERLPDNDKEVYVLVVHSRSGDIDYAKAKLSRAAWVFSTKPPYSKVVAWLEPDNFSPSRDELSRVPKDKIKY
jgi:hypothetical protein